jgi:hypothetical protein
MEDIFDVCYLQLGTRGIRMVLHQRGWSQHRAHHPLWHFANIAHTQTKGRSLEEMELIFNANHTQLDLEEAHHKAGQTVEHVENEDIKGKAGEKA